MLRILARSHIVQESNPTNIASCSVSKTRIKLFSFGETSSCLREKRFTRAADISCIYRNLQKSSLNMVTSKPKSTINNRKRLRRNNTMLEINKNNSSMRKEAKVALNKAEVANTMMMALWKAAVI